MKHFTNFLFVLGWICLSHIVFAQQVPTEICVIPEYMNHLKNIDFDGDGDVDLLVSDGLDYRSPANSGTNSKTIVARRFGWCENTGTLDFIYHDLFELDEAAIFAFGDVTGDGWVDFFYAEIVPPTMSPPHDGSNLYCRKNLGGTGFDAAEFLLHLPDGPIWTEEDGFPYYSDEEYPEYRFAALAVGKLGPSINQQLVLLLRARLFGTENPYLNGSGHLYHMGHTPDGWESPVYIGPAHSDGGGWLDWPTGTEYYRFDMVDINNDGNDDIFLSYLDGGINLVLREWPYTGSPGGGEVWGGGHGSEGDYDFGGVPPTGFPTVMFGMAGYIAQRQMSSPSNPSPYNYLIVFNNFAEPTVPGIVGGDFDFNGYPDVAMLTESGKIVIYFQVHPGWEETVDLLLPEELDLNLPYSPTALYYMDRDNDLDKDFLILAEGHLYILHTPVLEPTYGNLVVTSFYDENENSIRDEGEIELDYSHFILNVPGVGSMQYGQTTSSSILLPVGDYSITPLDVEGGNCTIPTSLDPIPFTVVLPGATTFIDIPYIVDPEAGSIGYLTLNIPQGLCSDSVPVTHIFSTQALCQTLNAATVDVKYVVESYFTFVDARPGPFTIDGDTISWQLEVSSLPMGIATVEVDLLPPSYEAMGEETFGQISFSFMDGVEDPVAFIGVNYYFIVVCAYDPNDITELTGWRPEGFVLDGQELYYHVNFQNTGNAPAHNVRVEIPLDDLVVPESFRFAQSSHPVTWSIENQLLTFFFNHINLPDSASFPEESKGYVQFFIDPLSGLAPGTEINHTGYIYFDFNPPIITNTELTTIFDCSMMTGPDLVLIEKCTDDATITANRPVEYAQNYHWTMDGQTLSNGAEAVFTNPGMGEYLLEQTISNPLCTVNYAVPLFINQTPPTPEMTIADNVISATGMGTFHWTFNGTPIQGFHGNQLPITQSGTYTVYVSFEKCNSAVATAEFTYVGIEERRSGMSRLSPVPTDAWATLAAADGSWDIDLTDLTGRIIRHLATEFQGTLQIDCRTLSPGYYFVRLTQPGKKEVLRLIVK